MAKSSETGGVLTYPDFAERLRFYLRSLTGDVHLAEDLYHDLVLKSLSSPQPMIQDYTAYYFRAARNLAITALQSKMRAREVQQDWNDWRVAVQPRSARPEDALEYQELLSSLEKLESEERELVLLKTHAELSFAEIAGILEQPKSSVAERYTRALQKLKQLLEADAPRTARATGFSPLNGALIS